MPLRSVWAVSSSHAWAVYTNHGNANNGIASAAVAQATLIGKVKGCATCARRCRRLLAKRKRDDSYRETVENVLVLRLMLLVPWRPGRQDKLSDT
jgi:hypothetical protein